MQTIAQTPPAVNGHTDPLPLPQFPQLPEAACSMTARVLVKAVSCESILITGRGVNGPEAARNLLESCAALKAQADAPPPLASRTQRLSLLLACGLEKAQAQGNTPRIERLLKACALVLAGCVLLADSENAEVRSQTEAMTTVYQVRGQMCTCQDAARHAEEPTHWCKHSLSVLLVRKLDEQERQENL